MAWKIVRFEENAKFSSGIISAEFLPVTAIVPGECFDDQGRVSAFTLCDSDGDAPGFKFEELPAFDQAWLALRAQMANDLLGINIGLLSDYADKLTEQEKARLYVLAQTIYPGDTGAFIAKPINDDASIASAVAQSAAASDVEQESKCRNCGICCGKDKDPCEQLIVHKDGTTECAVYDSRFGVHLTIGGRKLLCAPGCTCQAQVDGVFSGQATSTKE